MIRVKGVDRQTSCVQRQIGDRLCCEIRADRPNPLFNFTPQSGRQFPHFIDFQIRDSARPLVVCQVSLLTKRVKRADKPLIQSDRELEGVDHSEVVVAPFGLKPGRGQRRGRELESRVVGNIELPVVHQAGGLARRQVTICDGEQIGDLRAARLVLLEPAELEPVL